MLQVTRVRILHNLIKSVLNFLLIIIFDNIFMLQRHHDFHFALETSLDVFSFWDDHDFDDKQLFCFDKLDQQCSSKPTLSNLLQSAVII